MQFKKNPIPEGNPKNFVKNSSFQANHNIFPENLKINTY